MASLHDFDAREVEPARPFDPIPAGRYLAVIETSEMKSNKAATGHFLELTFKVAEGEFTNRLLWARLNLDNPNPMAVAIARAELSAICRSVGVLAPKDSAELHNLPLVIHVRRKERDDNGELANEIVGYSSKEPPAANTHAVSAGTPLAKPK